MSSIGSVLESRFKLKENKTNIQTEVLAGVTTFATMSYVLATIPNMLEQAGLVISGVSPDDRLAEAVELPDHPFFVGVQFHPEFKSRPNQPHPLFKGFISAALQQAKGKEV